MRRILGMAATALVAFSVSAMAEGIMVKDPWARASAGMARAGAAFMTIENHGSADKLLSARAEVSDRVELHSHINDNGVMRMREVPHIDLPMHSQAELKPGGLHVMFMGLDAPFKEGESFPVTLVFEKAGEKTVTVKIKAPGAMGAGNGHGHGHSHDHGKEHKH